ncbi:hypothetical protein C8R45DRAFT_755008, partial [Mycena sanguinolenta]
QEVLRASPRLGYLRVVLGSSTPPSFLAARLRQCTLDSLEELDLGTIEEYEDRTPLVFTTAPRLRKFRIIKMGVTPIVVPWAQLTELTYECDSQDETLDVLTQCPNLV